jgi:peptidoglycan hydrolase FlgJ
MPAALTRADIYTDLQGLEKLRASVGKGKVSADSLRQVAGQFEALFTQMMLKSMRQASFGDELFGSEQGDFYRDMHDQQLSLLLSKGKGMGLAEMLFKQLGGDKLVVDAPGANAGSAAGKADTENFVQTLFPHAQRAAQQLGVSPEILLAQAANETGWGKAVIRHADGRPSFNLFGIKADERWAGERVSVPTVEYQDGVAIRKRDTFRAYASYASSFSDYVDFLKNNPRYQEALSQANDPAAFAHALQQAGYSTDPAYGKKLISIMSGPALQDAVADLKIAGATPLTG